MLSPHLHFGEIGPRQIAAELGRLEEGAGKSAFMREIGWREFSHHLLFHNPDMGAVNLRSEFDRMPWRDDAEALRRWQRGQTGYPLVDAGMRELRTTGWMHNRVRMVAASFLTKHLMIDWRHGADWFWDTLVDAERANNSTGWQWVAGCGTDAAPYFRIFNPVAQSRRCRRPISPDLVAGTAPTAGQAGSMAGIGRRPGGGRASARRRLSSTYRRPRRSSPTRYGRLSNTHQAEPLTGLFRGRRSPCPACRATGREASLSARKHAARRSAKSRPGAEGSPGMRRSRPTPSRGIRRGGDVAGAKLPLRTATQRLDRPPAPKLSSF